MSVVDRVEVEDVSVPTGGSERTMVRIFRSESAGQPYPVVLYVGDPSTGGAEAGAHDHVREIVADTQVAVLVPRPAPDSASVGLEPLYRLLVWIVEQGQRRWLDGSRVALAGEGRGVELCFRLALLAWERGAPALRAGSLLWLSDDDPAAWREAGRFLSTALRGRGR